MKALTFEELPLQCGTTLPAATLAWCHYGPPPEKARTVTLLLHGISGSPQAAIAADDRPEFYDRGWFHDWIGPDRLFDTEDHCVLVPNALGSCFGSTGPQYWPQPDTFPDISIGDTVALQGLWLQALGIARLDAVIGYSYGGYQAFEWAMRAPVPVDKIVVLASGPRGSGSAADIQKLRGIAADLRSGKPGTPELWIQQRLNTLKNYGYALKLADDGVEDPAARLRLAAETWARQFSPWAMASLRGASVNFDVRQELADARNPMPLLWMQCQSDPLFPCEFTNYQENPRLNTLCIPGKYKHVSPTQESSLWIGHVAAFLSDSA
ncbi:alpha/beta fold hydrolase [Candidimonas nitroreducens]|uniref:alpha/beta fold hydrolase n=1 Tax=Candidimonas nitroreducens TaxID=683354 RepID=UPI0013032BBF|nr:alpha/beta fold hydrolase [Candidimonas nitroreducens]